jgi:hypothetical protein
MNRVEEIEELYTATLDELSRVRDQNARLNETFNQIEKLVMTMSDVLCSGSRATIVVHTLEPPEEGEE